MASKVNQYHQANKRNKWKMKCWITTTMVLANTISNRIVPQSANTAAHIQHSTANLCKQKTNKQIKLEQYHPQQKNCFEKVSKRNNRKIIVNRKSIVVCFCWNSTRYSFVLSNYIHLLFSNLFSYPFSVVMLSELILEFLSALLVPNIIQCYTIIRAYFLLFSEFSSLYWCI